MNKRERETFTLLSYGVSTLIVGGSNFLFVPLLIALLGQVGFVSWSLLEPVLLGAVPLAGLGIHIGLLRTLRTDERGTRESLSSLLPAQMCSAACAGIIVFALLTAWDTPPIVSTAACAVVFVEGCLLFFASFFRGIEKAYAFAAMEGGRILITLGTLYVTLHVAHHISIGMYLSIRAAIGGVVLVAALLALRVKFNPKSSATISAVRYGLPIVTASVLSVFLTSFDRYVLQSAASEHDLINYVAHVKLAQTLGLAASPFFTWFAPKAIQHLADSDDNHSFFRTATSALVTVVTLGAGTLWLLTPVAWPHLFPGLRYDPALFAILLAGTAVYALGNPVSLSALRANKTYQAILVTLAASFFGFAACILFVHGFGVFGAATGRLVGLLTYTGIFGTMTAITLRINYPVFRYGLIAATCGTLCLFLSRFVTSELSGAVTAFILTAALALISVAVLFPGLREKFFSVRRASRE